MVELPNFRTWPHLQYDLSDLIVFGDVKDRNYDVVTFFFITLTIPRVANFAGVIKIGITFIKTTLKDS